MTAVQSGASTVPPPEAHAVRGRHRGSMLIVVPHDPDDDLADLRAKYDVTPLYSLPSAAAVLAQDESTRKRIGLAVVRAMPEKAWDDPDTADLACDLIAAAVLAALTPEPDTQ